MKSPCAKLSVFGFQLRHPTVVLAANEEQDDQNHHDGDSHHEDPHCQQNQYFGSSNSKHDWRFYLSLRRLSIE